MKNLKTKWPCRFNAVVFNIPQTGLKLGDFSRELIILNLSDFLFTFLETSVILSALVYFIAAITHL